VIGSDEGFTAPNKMNTLKVESRFVVKVVQMKDREETRVGTCILQHGPGFERFESIGHATCGEAASPLVEVAEDDAGSGPGLFFAEASAGLAAEFSVAAGGSEV
jgi:hypothetical protein